MFFGQKPGAFAHMYMPLGPTSVMVCAALIAFSAMQDLIIITITRRCNADFEHILPGLVGDGFAGRTLRNAPCANSTIWHHLAIYFTDTYGVAGRCKEVKLGALFWLRVSQDSYYDDGGSL